VSWRTSHMMCFVVERYSGCRESSLLFRSKPKYSTIYVSRSGDSVNRRPILTLESAAQVVDLHQFLPHVLSADHITATPLGISRFRIAALSLDDYAAGLVYMAGLAHDAGQSAYDPFKDYPQSPGLKKVTANASGLIAPTPQGMAGTSRDLPAAEVADAGVLPCSSAFVVRPDI